MVKLLLVWTLVLVGIATCADNASARFFKIRRGCRCSCRPVVYCPPIVYCPPGSSPDGAGLGLPKTADIPQLPPPVAIPEPPPGLFKAGPNKIKEIK